MRASHRQRNPRLLFVTRALDVGGTERHLAQIAPGLVRRGFDVTLYCITKTGAQVDEIAASGIKVAGPAPAKGATRGLGTALTIASGALGLIPEMLLQRPDIAHFYLPHAFLAGSIAAAITQVPIRIMSRRCQNLYQLKHPRMARLEHWLHGSMTAVLGNSQSIVDELVHNEGVAAAKVGLIYNGIDLANFTGPVNCAEMRAKLGIEADAKVIGTLANLNSYKGHNDLVAALAMIKDRLPKPWHLLAIGRDDGELAALRAQSSQLGLDGNIHWLGMRRDTVALLRACDLAVLASHQEGFSNAVIESMAASLPMIVTGVGGNAEAVLHGINGLVVPARDPARLGDAIALLANNPGLSAAMGKAGQERAVSQFSIEACLNKYEAMYRALLARQTLPRDIAAAGLTPSQPMASQTSVRTAGGSILPPRARQEAASTGIFAEHA